VKSILRVAELEINLAARCRFIGHQHRIRVPKALQGECMKSSIGNRTGLVVATLFAAACAPDLPTEATSGGLAAARGGPGSPAYTSVDLGALLGNYSSSANDVNDAGDIVGGSCCGAGSGAFAIVAGALTPLPGNGFAAQAISNGNPRYVAGSAAGQPVRWTIANGVSSQPTALALGDASTGNALGVNDAGAAVGSAGVRAAVWDAAGNLAVTLLPSGFVRGEGRDINNAGDAVFVFSTAGSELADSRAYLRLASGQLVELPPLSGDVTSYANGISEVVNNSLYVAGTSRTSTDVSRSLRWTIDVTTGTITDTRLRPEDSHALGVSNEGTVTGFLDGPPSSLTFDAFLWRGSEMLSLKPPKRAKDGRAWAISPSGEFLAGEAIVGTTRHAVRWAILAP
jgi:uncharacterized membrane protein